MVRFQGIREGAALFRADSLTRNGLTHYCAIDLATRATSCTCEHGRYRMKPGTLASERRKLCVHCKRAARNLRRRERLGVAK